MTFRYPMSRRSRVIAASSLLLALIHPTMLRADIKNWQTGQTIPGTERITPGPWLNLSGWNQESRNLRYADFSGGLDLSGSSFYSSWLDNARFNQANLGGEIFGGATLTDTDLSQANLAGASFVHDIFFESTAATLTGVDFSGANLKSTRVMECNLFECDSSDLSQVIFSDQTTYNQYTVFRAEFDPVAAGLTFVPSPAGDFDANDL